MATPFIGLGLNAANVLVDKHFHKLPDKTFHKNTYIPGRKAKLSKRPQSGSDSQNENKTPDSSDGEDDDYRTQRGAETRKEDEIPRYSSDGLSDYPSPPQSITPLQYSREPPYPRQNYRPSPPSSQAYSYIPPYQQEQTRRPRRGYHDDDYYSDSYRSSRRPKTVARRSSSYTGPRSIGNSTPSQRYRSPSPLNSPSSSQLSKQKSKSSKSDKSKPNAKKGDDPYKFSEEMRDMFTSSDKGLAGGFAGAIVGGWAAQEAQKVYGRNKKNHQTSASVLTLIGAAVGGLAVNAVVDVYEDGKKKEGEERGSGDESEGRRSYGSKSNSRSRGSVRGRRDTWSGGYGSDGYD